MEPAGRYWKENFAAFVKPRAVDCKTAILNLFTAIKILVVGVVFAIAFLVARLFRRK